MQYGLWCAAFRSYRETQSHTHSQTRDLQRRNSVVLRRSGGVVSDSVCAVARDEIFADWTEIYIQYIVRVTVISIEYTYLVCMAYGVSVNYCQYADFSFFCDLALRICARGISISIGYSNLLRSNLVLRLRFVCIDFRRFTQSEDCTTGMWKQTKCNPHQKRISVPQRHSHRIAPQTGDRTRRSTSQHTARLKDTRRSHAVSAQHKTQKGCARSLVA
jgi:hypothetical protein